MRLAQYQYIAGDWTRVSGEDAVMPHLVLAFFATSGARANEAMQSLRGRFPRAHVAGCTTGGEILGPQLLTDAFVATAVEFSSSHVHSARQRIPDRQSSYKVGQQIGWALQAPDMRGMLILADGLETNGTHLVRGLRDTVDKRVALFGGLAGDGMDFIVTRVAANSELTAGNVVGIGFYGPNLTVSHSSRAGWTPSGRSGNVTHYSGSNLYEIDQQPALSWLKAQSGLQADAGMPELITQPLWLGAGAKGGVIRSILGLDEVRGSLILAGDVPGFGTCQLMRGDHASMVGAASHAASSIASSVSPQSLSILVSCICSRLVLGDRAGDEPQAVSRALGGIPQIGFYSYGEIGCVDPEIGSDFHNQTVAATVISEAA